MGSNYCYRERRRVEQPTAGFTTYFNGEQSKVLSRRETRHETVERCRPGSTDAAWLGYQPRRSNVFPYTSACLLPRVVWRAWRRGLETAGGWSSAAYCLTVVRDFP